MKKNGALERIRTSDHLIRSQVLYPAELRVHWKIAEFVNLQKIKSKIKFNYQTSLDSVKTLWQFKGHP